MGLLKPKKPAEKERWYREGLRFRCTQCGNCCAGEPGHVWVDRKTIHDIAAFLGRDDEWLGKTRLRRVGFRYSLTEKRNGDCVFLVRENGKTMCGIHPVRPAQCRTWPFWAENLRSRIAWERAAEDCPGMNQGRLVSLSVIDQNRRGEAD
jgi:Fe-S-cluster containining protein